MHSTRPTSVSDMIGITRFRRSLAHSVHCRPTLWLSVQIEGRRMSKTVEIEASNARQSRLWLTVRLLVQGTIACMILLIVCLGLRAIPMPSGSLARDLIIHTVKNQTGRTLTVKGASKLSWFPSIRLRLDDVVLSGPTDAYGPPPITADRLEVGVKIISLWRRQFEVTEISLQRPVLTMAAGDPLLIRVAEGEVRADGIPQQVNITDGRIVILGSPSKSPLQIDKVTGQLARTENGKGFNFNGHLEANGEIVAIDGEVGDLKALADGDISPLTFSLNNKLLAARFDGGVGTQPIGQITGRLSARSDAFPGLLKWAQIDAQQSNPGRSAMLEGRIAGSLRRITLSDGKLTLDAVTGDLAGEFSIEGERPTLTAGLTTGKLDINALLPAAARPAAFGIAPLDNSTALPTAWQSLMEELEETPSGTTAALGSTVAPIGWWSTAPFRLARLPDVDTELTIKADEIAYGDLPLKNGQLVVNSSPQRLEVLVNRVDLYQGSMSGRVELDLGNGPLATGLRLKFKSLELEPFTAEMLRQRLISGTGDIDISVDGRGGSMRELVGSLNGSMNMDLVEGSIVGFDLGRAIANFGSDQTYNPASRTPFKRVRAAFSLRNGVLRSTEALRLTGPVIVLTSHGSLGLVSQRVDQRLKLSLSTPPPHLPIPLRVRGTVDRPDIKWDIFSAVAWPAKFATPFAVGDKNEKMPEKVRCIIEKKLAADASETTLSPASRSFLQDLLEKRQPSPRRHSSAHQQVPESCSNFRTLNNAQRSKAPSVASWEKTLKTPPVDVLPEMPSVRSSLPPMQNQKRSALPPGDGNAGTFVSQPAPPTVTKTRKRRRRVSSRKNSARKTDWKNKALFQD